MTFDCVIIEIVATVASQVANGAHWGNHGEEIARIAVKRWGTYARRHPSAKRVADWERVVDLAKGFEAHFETGEKPWNIPDGEWNWLAESLVQILRAHES